MREKKDAWKGRPSCRCKGFGSRKVYCSLTRAFRRRTSAWRVRTEGTECAATTGCGVFTSTSGDDRARRAPRWNERLSVEPDKVGYVAALVQLEAASCATMGLHPCRQGASHLVLSPSCSTPLVVTSGLFACHSWNVG